MAIWSFRNHVDEGKHEVGLGGYEVVTTDGQAGKIDGSRHGVGPNFLVVDIGHWIHAKKVVIPAGMIEKVDHEERKVYVDKTRDQIENSPDLGPDDPGDSHHDLTERYWAEMMAGIPSETELDDELRTNPPTGG
jgi:hypothetical protein